MLIPAAYCLVTGQFGGLGVCMKEFGISSVAVRSRVVWPLTHRQHGYSWSTTSPWSLFGGRCIGPWEKGRDSKCTFLSRQPGERHGGLAFEPEEGGEIHVHPAVESLFGFRHQRVLYLSLPGVSTQGEAALLILAVAQPESYAAARRCASAGGCPGAGAGLGLFSSRNVDYPREGFPYRFRFTHRLCDATTRRRSSPDVCFYRPEAAPELARPYARRLVYAPSRRRLYAVQQDGRDGLGGRSREARDRRLLWGGW